VVQPEEKVVSVPFGSGFEDDHLCTYWFQFSVHAGPGDLMQIEFTTVKNAGMTFSAGTSYSSALTGAKMNEPEGGMISIPYPNGLFLTFFNTGSDGALEIKAKYEDGKPEDAIAFMGKTFELKKAKVMEKDADLTIVYISAILLGMLIIIVIICIGQTYRYEQRAND